MKYWDEKFETMPEEEMTEISTGAFKENGQMGLRKGPFLQEKI